jgi:uncharacterized pyridoxamine 5'-phosphate oxidase family protein
MVTLYKKQKLFIGVWVYTEKIQIVQLSFTTHPPLTKNIYNLQQGPIFGATFNHESNVSTIVTASLIF